MKRIKEILKNKKLLFCLGIFFLSFLLILVILVVKPMKLNTKDIYDSTGEIVIKDIEFPMEQDISVDVDNLNAITIYPGDFSLNEFQYQIELTDEDGKRYFYHDFVDYQMDYMYLFFGNIPNSKGKTMHLKITCDECKNVKMNVAKSNLKDTNIIGSDMDSLQISMNYYTKNNSYYWYSLLGIVIAFTFLPLVGSGIKNGK